MTHALRVSYEMRLFDARSRLDLSDNCFGE